MPERSKGAAHIRKRDSVIVPVTTRSNIDAALNRHREWFVHGFSGQPCLRHHPCLDACRARSPACARL
jgi:hypothetical protein